MMEEETKRLLTEFARGRSEPAFRELVRTHSPVVFGTAVRMLAGDRAAAEDVTQEVFALLARKAGDLGGVVLSAWLYRQTCRRAANHVRAESRRRARELAAVGMMNNTSAEPSGIDESLGGEVDAAMLSLPSRDRDALVLRFFEGQDFRRLGATLGTTEEAARKRVTRAMDKLAAALRRRGVAAAGVSLGATMTRLGAAPVPPSLVSRVTAQAMKAAPQPGGWFAEGLKPVVAGVVAGSLATGSTLALLDRRAPPPASAALATMAVPSPRPDSEVSAAGDLIAELKRIHAAPRHTLTTLRLRATLERIAFDDLPDFFPLAHDKLTPAEQAACFKLLLERWVRHDPDAALTFMIGHPLWARVDLAEGTNLLSNIFEQWMHADLPAARGWLLRHWGAEALREEAFLSTLREFFAMKIADTLVRHGRMPESAEFIRSIPDESARRDVMFALTGSSPWMGAWMNLDTQRLHELLQSFQSHPDAAFGQMLAASLWRNVMENSPARAKELVALMTPADRFAHRLGELGVRRKPVRTTPMAGGGRMTSFEQIEAAPVDEESLIRDGLAAGLTRGETLVSVAAAFDAGKDRERALAWIDAHRHDTDFDDLILGKLRELGGPVTGWVSGDTAYARVIEWASRLGDEETGRAICRGAFRRMQHQMPREIEGFLRREDIPAAIRGELQHLADTAP